MTQPDPAPSWTPPPEEPGPGPGMEFAPHGPRLAAYILDGLLLTFMITALTLVITAVFFAGGPTIDPNDIANPRLITFISVLIFAILMVTLAYFPFFWTRNGQTPGMRPFDLFVVRDQDGGRINAGTALLRLVGYWVSGFAFSLGYIWILIDKRRRGWHDLLAGTIVVRRSR